MVGDKGAVEVEHLTMMYRRVISPHFPLPPRSPPQISSDSSSDGRINSARDIIVISRTRKMRYLIIFLVSTASLILSAKGKIQLSVNTGGEPHRTEQNEKAGYIHICKQSDPHLTECILDSILNLRERLVTGIPELQVPPIDPLHLRHLDINLGPGLKAEARDLLITGGKKFIIEDLRVDIDANTHSFNVTLPELAATGVYEIDARIGAIPLKGKGPIRFTAKSASGIGSLRGKHVVRGGITYNWFPSMSFKLDVKDYVVQLDNLFEGQPAIGEATNRLLNEEQAEILRSITPGLEKALIEHILATANNIVKNFSWNELFPKS